MQKKNFGKICASLRKDIFNPVKGRTWSQEDLAEAANLPLKLIGQIERGEKVKLEGELLTALANAYGLTSTERNRFFSLAADITPDEVVQPGFSFQTTLQQLLKQIEKIQQPVLLHDGLYRILALNSAYREVYGLTASYLATIDDNDPTKYHIVRHIHDPASPVRALYENHLRKAEINNAIYWRYLSLSQRAHPLFDTIQETLKKKFPRFATIWHALNDLLAERDALGVWRHFSCNHPRFGRLTYLIISTQLSFVDKELYLTLLSPLNVHTYKLFDNLIQAKSFALFSFESNMKGYCC